MRLSDAVPQERYVEQALPIFLRWEALPDASRTSCLEDAVQKTAQLVGIPKLGTTEHGGSGTFKKDTWTMEIVPAPATSSPLAFGQMVGEKENPVKQWAYWATMAYHELRHAEQYFMIAQGVFRGALSIPTRRRCRNVLDTLTIQDVRDVLGYPVEVIEAASKTCQVFSPEEIPRTRRWLESEFSGGSGTRDHIMTQVDRLSPEHVRRPKEPPVSDDARLRIYRRYRELPMEADAWDVADQVALRLRGRIQAVLHYQAAELLQMLN